jgi:hypothetical protein
MGMPVPANAEERVVGDMASAVGGVGGAGKLASKAAPAVASFFGSQPVMQSISAGLGSGAAGVTRENDGGMVAQIMAAILGGLSPAVVKTAVKGLLPNTTQAGRENAKGMLLNEAAGGQKNAVLDALDAEKSFIPGERPTAAQAASIANAPAFAGVEKLAVQKYNPNLAAARNAENMDARLAAVRSVGKDEPALKSAISTREANATEHYGKAFKELVNDDSTFADLMTRPSMKAAVSRAKELAAEANDQPFSIGQTTPERVVPGPLVRNQNGMPRISSVVIPEEIAKFPVQSLHKLKKALDDVIAKPERFIGIGESERAAALNTRGEFLKWMTDKSKAYAKAKAVYAKDSIPVNQMQVGQYLEDKLLAPLSEDTQRPGLYAQALRDAPGTIKSATGGGPRYESLTDVMSQGQVGLLGNVKSSLEREAITAKQGTAGSARARDIVGSELGAIDLPNWLSKSVTLARYALEKIGVKTIHKTLGELAKDLQDPGTAARLMREASPDQWAAIGRVMRATAKPVGSGLLQSLPQTESQ